LNRFKSSLQQSLSVGLDEPACYRWKMATLSGEQELICLVLFQRLGIDDILVYANPASCMLLGSRRIHSAAPSPQLSSEVEIPEYIVYRFDPVPSGKQVTALSSVDIKLKFWREQAGGKTNVVCDKGTKNIQDCTQLEPQQTIYVN
jgi:hypothetical protein